MDGQVGKAKERLTQVKLGSVKGGLRKTLGDASDRAVSEQQWEWVSVHRGLRNELEWNKSESILCRRYTVHGLTLQTALMVVA